MCYNDLNWMKIMEVWCVCAWPCACVGPCMAVSLEVRKSKNFMSLSVKEGYMYVVICRNDEFMEAYEYVVWPCMAYMCVLPCVLGCR